MIGLPLPGNQPNFQEQYLVNPWKYDFLWKLLARALQKKLFLKNSQNSEKNTCATVLYLLKLQAGGLQF